MAFACDTVLMNGSMPEASRIDGSKDGLHGHHSGLQDPKKGSKGSRAASGEQHCPKS